MKQITVTKPGKLVSIIIPTYKNRGNLSRAIDSALSQTYKNIEIIVIDDNNSDDKWRAETEQLMSQLYGNYPNIIYLKHTENKNGAAARNTGIHNSRGQYIAFLDDDDYFKENKIELQVKYLETHTEYDAVYCQCEKAGKILATNLPIGNLAKDIFILKTHMYTPSLLFRKDSLIAIDGFDESFRRHQDYELLVRFFNSGYKIGAVNECLTVIGANQGENIPDGRKMEQLKIDFLNKFDAVIRSFSEQNPGYIKAVVARNYSSVFLAYLKNKDLKNSLRIMIKYAWLNPKYFFSPILRSLRIHILK